VHFQKTARYETPFWYAQTHRPNGPGFAAMQEANMPRIPARWACASAVPNTWRAWNAGVFFKGERGSAELHAINKRQPGTLASRAGGLLAYFGWCLVVVWAPLVCARRHKTPGAPGTLTERTPRYAVGMTQESLQRVIVIRLWTEITSTDANSLEWRGTLTPLGAAPTPRAFQGRDALFAELRACIPMLIAPQAVAAPVEPQE
jgi:hypothetical protein